MWPVDLLKRKFLIYEWRRFTDWYFTVLPLSHDRSAKRWEIPTSPAPRVLFDWQKMRIFFRYVPPWVSVLISKGKIFPGNIQSLATCWVERITNTYCSSSDPDQHPSKRKCTDRKTPSNDWPYSRYAPRANKWDWNIFWKIDQSLFTDSTPTVPSALGSDYINSSESLTNRLSVFSALAGIDFFNFLKDSSARSTWQKMKAPSKNDGIQRNFPRTYFVYIYDLS